MVSIVINSDKTISINGKKTFMVALWGVTNQWDSTTESASTSISKVKPPFMLHMGGVSRSAPTEEDLAQITALENGGMYWLGNPGNTRYDTPYFFGTQLWQEPDLEGQWYYPNCNTAPEGWVQCAHTETKKRYNNKKIVDPNHPIVLPIMGKVTPSSPSSFKYWSDTSDILTCDDWDYTDNITGNRRDLAVFFYEINIYDHLLWDANGSLDNIIRPVWIGILAAGSSLSFYILSEKEMREQVYTAITLNCQGIAFWGYKTWESSTTQRGLVSNPTAFNVTKHVAEEVRSLNDILVLPTESYRWARFKSNDIVTLTGTYNTTVVSWGRTYNEPNFNWILKKDPASGIRHLIVINKGNNSVTTTIKVSSSSYTGPIYLVGNQTSGSASFSRTVNASNGVFSDTFDPHTVHIYKIGGSAPSQPPTTQPPTSQPPQNECDPNTEIFVPSLGCMPKNYLIYGGLGFALLMLLKR